MTDKEFKEKFSVEGSRKAVKYFKRVWNKCVHATALKKDALVRYGEQIYYISGSGVEKFSKL